MSEAEELFDFAEEPEGDTPLDQGKQTDTGDDERRGGGRAAERIQQLVAERNQERLAREALEARVKSMEGLKDQVGSLLAERKAAEEAAKAKAAEVKVPDFLEDPVGHVDAKVSKLQAEIARLEAKAADGNEKAEREAVAAKEQLAFMQFQTRVQASESDFVKAHPDYFDALNHARNVRVQEMQYLGMENAEIAKAINTEEINAAMAAIARGKDPAEFVYKRAVAAGFKSGAAPTGNSKLDEEVALYERRRMAQSIGSNQDGGDDLEPAGDAWAAVESAFKDLFGENLR